MNSKDWVMLKTVFEERNITKAAERLYISQPAITYRIRQIEAEFGEKILLSDSKGVQFTTEGYLLVEYCKRMIIEEEKIRDTIANTGNDTRGALQIGASHSFSEYNLPFILQQFLDICPHVNVTVTTASSYEIINLLRNDQINIGIEYLGDHTDLTSLLICRENIVAVTKVPVSLNDLSTLTMIDYDKNEKLKSLINGWWKDNFKESPLTNIDVCFIQTCKEMIKCGLGFSILPEFCIQKNDHLFKLALYDRENRPLQRDVWMTYRDFSLNISTVKNFVNFIKREKNNWKFN